MDPLYYSVQIETSLISEQPYHTAILILQIHIRLFLHLLQTQMFLKPCYFILTLHSTNLPYFRFQNIFLNITNTICLDHLIKLILVFEILLILDQIINLLKIAIESHVFSFRSTIVSDLFMLHYNIPDFEHQIEQKYHLFITQLTITIDF